MTTETVHVHRWLLMPDETKNVYGSCARCGAERFFQGVRYVDENTAFRASIKANATAGKRAKDEAK